MYFKHFIRFAAFNNKIHRASSTLFRKLYCNKTTNGVIYSNQKAKKTYPYNITPFKLDQVWQIIPKNNIPKTVSRICSRRQYLAAISMVLNVVNNRKGSQTTEIQFTVDAKFEWRAHNCYVKITQTLQAHIQMLFLDECTYWAMWNNSNIFFVWQGSFISIFTEQNAFKKSRKCSFDRILNISMNYRDSIKTLNKYKVQPHTFKYDSYFSLYDWIVVSQPSKSIESFTMH